MNPAFWEVWNLVFPDGLTCMACEGDAEDGKALCPACRADFEAWDGEGEALWVYGGTAEKLVKKLKYAGQTAIARVIGYAMAEYIQQNHITADALVPVPMAFFRRWRRGYNQAQLIAQALSHYSGIPCLPRALVRRHRAAPQASLGRAARLQNLQGALRPGPQKVAGLRVLLIDEVYTTGATAAACSRVLKSAGCTQVRALTACRVPAPGLQDKP
nr:ComF family protein [bacterium]